MPVAPSMCKSALTVNLPPLKVQKPHQKHKLQSLPRRWMMMMMIVSQFNGTSTPKGSHHAKTGDNDCNVNSSRYSLRTALCESICSQAKSEQNV